MLLGLYLLVNLFAAALDVSVRGIPVETGLRVLQSVGVKQGYPSPRAVLLTLINQARAGAGLKPLQWDSRLSTAAHEHAQIMSTTGQVSHQFPNEPDLPNRLTAKLRLDQAGENVFYDASVQNAHEAFMKSPAHDANLLNPAYDSIGIGIVEKDGILYIVEDFAHRIPELSNEEAAEGIAQQFVKLRQSTVGGDLAFRRDPRVQQLACSMAKSETKVGKLRMPVSGLLGYTLYATAKPNELPPNVARLSTLNSVGDFGVGVCYAQTPKYPTGLYWVTTLLFRGSSMTAYR